MTNPLKLSQPSLYRRVRLKGILHLILGSILLFFPSQAPTLSSTPLLSFYGVTAMGITYLIIGTLILGGLHYDKNHYALAQVAMRFAFVFNLLVFLSLLAIFYRSTATAFIVTIYGYLTYNIYYVAREPSWKALRIAKEYVDDARSIYRSNK